SITLRLGRVPYALRKKQLEANLVIVYGNKVCYYRDFVDIPRTNWDLLPMGLYMDTLQNLSSQPDGEGKRRWTYQRKVEWVVPFAKNKTGYDETQMQRIVDSLHLGNYIIRQGEVRAYSSVEGFEAANRQLERGRANAMTALIKKLQPGLKRISSRTGENWLEFYRDLKSTPYASLGGMTRPQIKLRLLDRAIADSLEPVLAKERKAMVTLYCEQKQGMEDTPKATLLSAFRQAVADRNIDRARRIQREIFERVSDNQLPGTYLYQLEVPKEKTYWELINDRIIFRYQAAMSNESQALEAFQELSALDPGNGRIRYNVCALTLFKWHIFGSVDQQTLLADIHRLQQQGIDVSLVKRMLVNYHILLSYDLLDKEKYDEKDSSVQLIRNTYESLPLTDEDRLSLAKYFVFYSQHFWAEEVVAPRVDQLDVSADLVFYFVNLGFFKSTYARGEDFLKAFINAFTLDRGRFCHFFDPIDKGGASMQLLEQSYFRDVYCEKCRALP
ncbi:MAG TPA: hypothetical protein VNW04_18075, partial [Puia sp.]|nr:hypothetical protein [Puia sp.]